MAESSLVLHCGAVPVTEEGLKAYKAPPPSGRWFPVSHSRVLDTVKGTLVEAGYTVRREQLGVMRDGSRFFGTLDLGTPLSTGVTLAVGVRNSVDKSFPLGFIAGNRVFCCDNLAFKAELSVRRKHTVRGEARFAEGISTAVASLAQFKEVEAARIKAMIYAELSNDQADALILRAFERGIISSHHLPRVIHEWRQPQFEDFQPRTAWSLLNCFTTVLADRAVKMPHAFATQTMRLNALLEVRDAASPEFVQAT